MIKTIVQPYIIWQRKMFNKEYIQKRLEDLKITPLVVENYAEEHRYYHNLNHISFILNKLNDRGVLNDNILFLAAVFHDVIYNPKSNTNEEDSVLFFEKATHEAAISTDEKKQIAQLIIETKLHKASSEKSALFQQVDLAIFDQPFIDLLEYEQQIFKEFQFVDYLIYKPKRIEVLEQYNSNGQLNGLIDYVKFRKPQIGVFAGSFNPFHKGHFNVLEKAERIFDKVIIAFGKNPVKNQRNWEIPKTIEFRQSEEYEGLLTDYIDSLSYDVTVIRGLRNSTDFQYEQNQYRYIQELKPTINIVNIFCDKEFEHISSSGIRTLEKYNKHYAYLLD